METLALSVLELIELGCTFTLVVADDAVDSMLDGAAEGVDAGLLVKLAGVGSVDWEEGVM